MKMIIWRDWPLTNDHPSPRHPNHLSQDPDSISRTFLEQFDLVSFFGMWWVGWGQKSHLTEEHSISRSIILRPMTNAFNEVL